MLSMDVGGVHMQSQSLHSTQPSHLAANQSAAVTNGMPQDYPNKAPVVKFRTRMFHPNSEPWRQRGGGP